MQKHTDEVQAAVDTLARALARAADDVEFPPEVNFSVCWIEVTVIDQARKSYQPVIRLSVTKREMVKL